MSECDCKTLWTCFGIWCWVLHSGGWCFNYGLKEHRIIYALHRNVRFPSCVLSWGPWLCQTKKEEKRWFESSKLSIPLDLKCEGMPTIFTIFHTWFLLVFYLIYIINYLDTILFVVFFFWYFCCRQRTSIGRGVYVFGNTWSQRLVNNGIASLDSFYIYIHSCGCLDRKRGGAVVLYVEAACEVQLGPTNCQWLLWPHPQSTRPLRSSPKYFTFRLKRHKYFTLLSLCPIPC